MEEYRHNDSSIGTYYRVRIRAATIIPQCLCITLAPRIPLLHQLIVVSIHSTAKLHRNHLDMHF